VSLVGLSPVRWAPAPSSSVCQPLNLRKELPRYPLHLPQTKCVLSPKERAYKAPSQLNFGNRYKMTKYPSEGRVQKAGDRPGSELVSFGARGLYMLSLTHEDHCGLCIFRDLLHQLQVFTVALRVMEMRVFLLGKNKNK